MLPIQMAEVRDRRPAPVHESDEARSAVPNLGSIDTAAGDGGDVGPWRSRTRLVAAAAWLMLAVCLAGSVVMAVTQRASVRLENQRAFAVSSGDVAASMASALRRDTDFVATMGSTMASWPQMSSAQFARENAGLIWPQCDGADSS